MPSPRPPTEEKEKEERLVRKMYMAGLGGKRTGSRYFTFSDLTISTTQLALSFILLTHWYVNTASASISAVEPAFVLRATPASTLLARTITCAALNIPARRSLKRPWIASWTS